MKNGIIVSGLSGAWLKNRMAYTETNEIDTWTLENARQIVLSLVKNKHISVYLYGSRATGKTRRFSDIDIALEADTGKVDDALIAEIRDRFEESDIPYTVDVVDLSRTSKKFREKIRKEGIEWKD